MQAMIVFVLRIGIKTAETSVTEISVFISVIVLKFCILNLVSVHLVFIILLIFYGCYSATVNKLIPLLKTK